MVSKSLPEALKVAGRAAVLAGLVMLASCSPDDDGGTVGNIAQGPARRLAPVSDALKARMVTLNMEQDAPIMVRLFKEESKFEVWKQTRNGQYAMLVSYDICKWSGLLGPKVKEGDRQAPEGFYAITPGLMNANSSYFLAFNTGFPNAYDRAMGRSGSALMVHGSCSSRGCYAMTDQAIAEIFSLARDAFAGGQRSFQMQAYPFRMTAENMALHYNDPNMPFWRNLKVGYDHFQVTRIPPKVDVCGRKYVFDSSAGSGQIVPTRDCPQLSVPQAVELAVASKQRADDARTAKLVADLRAKRLSGAGLQSLMLAGGPAKATGGADGSLVRVAAVSKPKRTSLFGGTAGLDRYQKAALTAAAQAGDPVAIAALGSPLAPPVLAPGATAPATIVTASAAPLPGTQAPVSAALSPLASSAASVGSEGSASASAAAPTTAGTVATEAAGTQGNGGTTLQVASIAMPPVKPGSAVVSAQAAQEPVKTGWFASLFGGSKPAKPSGLVPAEADGSVATTVASISNPAAPPVAAAGEPALPAASGSASIVPPVLPVPSPNDVPVAVAPAPAASGGDQGWLSGLFGGKKAAAAPQATAAQAVPQPQAAPQPAAAAPLASAVPAAGAAATAAPTVLASAAESPAKSGGWLDGLFGGNKQKPAAEPAGVATAPVATAPADVRTVDLSAPAVVKPPRLPLPAPAAIPAAAASAPIAAGSAASAASTPAAAAQPVQKHKVLPATTSDQAASTPETVAPATAVPSTAAAAPSAAATQAMATPATATATVATAASTKASATNTGKSGDTAFAQTFSMFN